MEDDFDANQSELKYLRIQLKAIEAQCSQYIPRNEDPELAQAIKNWKIDWEDIDRRSKARRKKCLVSLTQSSSDRSTIVDGTWDMNSARRLYMRQPILDKAKKSAEGRKLYYMAVGLLSV